MFLKFWKRAVCRFFLLKDIPPNSKKEDDASLRKHQHFTWGENIRPAPIFSALATSCPKSWPISTLPKIKNFSYTKKMLIDTSISIFFCVKKHEMNFLLFLYTIKFLIIDKSFGCETNLQTSALRLLSGGIFCTGGRLKRYALWCIERSGKDSSMHE